MPTIELLPSGIHAAAREGETLLQVLLQAGIEMDPWCGGAGACATCRVVVQAGAESLSPMSNAERALLRVVDGLTADARLACAARVHGDATVRVPPRGPARLDQG